MQLERDDVRTLVDIGFIALSRGLTRHAAAIFEGVRAARPQDEAGPLGQAMVAMATSDFAGATALLRALPPSDAALTFLGMALARMGETAEARERLASVVRTSPDTAHGALARAALDELG